ncbi:MAG: DUF4350 domain-containing protein [Acidobacteriia bacterium]|nr:DUF4350 domain-containing protein [Terriglobia bacterium]
MPLQLTAGDRKILLISAGVFLVLVAAALLLVRGTSSEQDIPSAYSAASGGCKAAFLLLQESGYRVQAWERPLSELTDPKGKTLVIVQPASFPPKEEREKLEQFLRSGGRLIAAGRFSGYYLPLNEATPNPLSGTTWRQIPALSLSPITRAAPEITMAPQGYWRPSSGAVGLYGETDKPVAVEYTIGEGKVLWLAEATPLTNAGLKETGNLEFLLAAVGSPDQSEVLWDEYVHGYETSAATSASSRVIGWIGLQLAVFAVAILLTYSRRSGPVWIPQDEVRLSPLEFVRTLGSLYEHAKAGNVAVEISYQRFRYLLTRRLGLSNNASVDDLGRAVRERWGLQDEEFTLALSESESCRYDPNVPASTALRLVQALFDYAVRLKLIRSPQGEN